ncbi:Twinkle-like protein [Picochlorum sp. SENEW3]|nr:Twinkle-like protein [Picochlorum sp. SENEW3]
MNIPGKSRQNTMNSMLLYRKKSIEQVVRGCIRCASTWNNRGQRFNQKPVRARNVEEERGEKVEPPVEFRHRQYLLALAKANVLPRLLEDGPRLKEMGIPESEFARLMRKPENHGMKGFESAKKLLYTADPEHPEQGELDRMIPLPQRRPADRYVSLTAKNPPQELKPSVEPKKDEERNLMPANSIENALKQHMIDLPIYNSGEHRVLCPKCQGGSSGEKSLSVTIDPEKKSAKWNCFRATCGFSGGCHADNKNVASKAGFLVPPSSRKRKEEPIVRPQVQLEPLTQEMLDFFSSRGIRKETLDRNRVSCVETYDPMLKKKSRVIGFPYHTHDTLVNVKYRSLDKRFWQVKGAEKMLYGLNDVVGESELIIVEGEMDKLAMEEAGVTNVVSVPDGAPARVKEGELPTAEEDTKYSYLWNSRAWLDQAVRIIIATDNDAPGDALAEELARRLGRERCWRVRWPFTREDHEFIARTFGDERNFDVSETETESVKPGQPDPAWYRKDANEVLMKDGPKMLQNFVESAEPLPIRGLLRFHEYYDDIMKYYYLELKDGQGVKTGWPTLDRYYRVVPGELTIVTGVPNSGKSEWIDALLCNLSEQQGWQFAMCSMEKRATDHARQLAEKYVGKPFFDLPYSKGTPRMSFEELDSAMDWVDDRFHLIRYEDDELPSVDWVLDIARAAVYRYGIRGLVIDPYNELDHQRPSSMSETEYVSKMLTKVKRFAQTAGVHVWFVAHPRQLHQWKGEAPNLYDISGSAHFINKADNGIVIHRNRDPDGESPDSVEILVRKVRNKAAGTIGNCSLSYDRRNGRYLDFEDPTPPRTSEAVPSVMNGQNFVETSRGYYVNDDGTVSSN